MRLSLLLSLLFSPFVVLAAPSPSRTRGLTIVESPSPSHTISTNPFDIYMPTPFDEHDELMPSDELEELGDEDKENTSGLLVIRPTAGPAHPIPSRSRRDSMEEYVDSTPLQEYASSSLFSPFSSHDPQQTRIEDLSMDQLTQVLEKAILVRHQLFLSINTHRKEWKKVKNLNEVTRYLYQKRQVQYSHELEWRHANIEQVIDALEERRIELMLVNARADRDSISNSALGTLFDAKSDSIKEYQKDDSAQRLIDAAQLKRAEILSGLSDDSSKDDECMRTEEEEEEDFDYNDAVDVHVPDVQREDQELDFEFLGSASY